MLLRNEDGTYTADARDVIVILFRPDTKRYHVAFYEWHPLPGELSREKPLEILRLKSKMHHTLGAETREEALKQLTDMRLKLKIEDRNVNQAHVYPWDGEQGHVWFVRPWDDCAFQDINPGELHVEARCSSEHAPESPRLH